MKIGFFDSGLGGLTILRTVAKELPDYDYLYYGDTEHVPYGNKPETEIYQLTTSGVRYLFENGCALVVIACNTASSETARRLQQEFLPTEYPNRKILGIIVPTIEELAFNKPTNVTLIATKRTVESKKYERELAKKGNGNTTLTTIATPDLVPMIEQNEIAAAAKHAIKVLEEGAGESEVIVLGCTHYTEIKKALREHFADKTIISQDEIIPKKLQAYLHNHPEIETKLTKEATRTIHLTAHRPDYDRLTAFFLGGVFCDNSSIE